MSEKVGSFSFEEAGRQNPYDEHVESTVYAHIGGKTEAFTAEQREKGVSAAGVFKILTETKMYLHAREEDGKEVKQANFSANFNTFYTTPSTSAEHYRTLFHVLWAGGYSLEEIEGFTTAQAENVAEANRDDFIDVASEGMRLFLEELQG